MDRIEPTQRPKGKCKGYQTWSELSFLHWQVPVESIRGLVPETLEIDTFNGTAWVGLVPFRMSNVRPRQLPAIPGLSAFNETNVRTYVHLNGERPGVWFFSLDAKNHIAVAIARHVWNLNYHYSKMEFLQHHREISYSGKRPNGSASYEIRVELECAVDRVQPEQAEPGTLLHFLTERYILYTQSKSGMLLSGQVHHQPYPLVKAETLSCNETLLQFNGILVDGLPVHTVFSPGVDVEVFELHQVR